MASRRRRTNERRAIPIDQIRSEGVAPSEGDSQQSGFEPGTGSPDKTPSSGDRKKTKRPDLVDFEDVANIPEERTKSEPAIVGGPVVPEEVRRPLYLALGVLLVSLIWAFYPTMVKVVGAWIREGDYSHGWLVIPFVIYLLYSFRESMPPLKLKFHVGGLIALGITVLLRMFSGWAFFDFMDGWMIPLMVISLSWIIGGRKLMFWAVPSLAFLFFMIPLPYRIENELSRPLQWIATNSSSYVLQLLGQPAISEGTTILLGENVLEVERACSGLRIFMGVFALSYVYALLARRNVWEGIVIVLAAIPIALIANMGRIVTTGLCYQWLSGDTARHFAHDIAGYAMIVFAAAMFGLLVLYLRWLIQEAQTMDQISLRRV